VQVKKTNQLSAIFNAVENLKGILIAKEDDQIVSISLSDNFKKDFVNLPYFDSFNIANLGSLSDNYKHFNKMITENAVNHFYNSYSSLLQAGRFVISNDDIFINKDNTVRLFIKFDSEKNNLMIDLDIHYLLDSMNCVQFYREPEMTDFTIQNKGIVEFYVEEEFHKTDVFYFFRHHSNEKDLREAVKFYDRRQFERAEIIRIKNKRAA
jgi:hypothetical protein